jgi:hypothetical protein
MNEGGRVILNYAMPKPANRFARMPAIGIILLAILVPGLSSSLVRGSVWKCATLCGVVAAAFLIFGPLWGEVLFPGRLSELGLYPFLLTVGVVETISIVMAISDRTKAQSAEVEGGNRHL